MNEPKAAAIDIVDDASPRNVVVAAPAPSVVVAVPARNEVERIGDCLRALCFQAGATPDVVLVLVNNSRDGTAAAVRELAPGLPVPITLIEVELEPAGAGFARRAAMAEAAVLAGPGGLLLTTDADGVVAPDWLARTLAAIEAGSEAVMGRALIDPEDARAIPAALHEDDARECAYAAALDRIADRLDPDPADPWPRHDEASGASMAVTVAAYRRAGGMPAVASGEDRDFAAALRAVDAAVRHEPGVTVTVSGRLVGRAEGGMADTIRRRMVQPDRFLDDRLEPVEDRMRRLRLRRAVREAWAIGAAGPGLVEGLALDGETVAAALRLPFFGAAWRVLEAASPLLRASRVPVGALAGEMAAAVAWLAGSGHAGSGAEAVEAV